MLSNHDGEILKKLLSELGVKKAVLAEKINKNPNTITRILQRQVIKNELLIDIGKALRFDLTQKFPRLKKVPEATKLNYFNEDPDELLTKVSDIEEMYGKVEKKSADLELEIKFLKEKVHTLETLIEAKDQIIKMQDEKLKSFKDR
ncbi:MAG: hypothetical protein ACFHWX_04120 [Bacteroidota bacterium]